MSLERKIDELFIRIGGLEAEVLSLRSENTKLRKENTELKLTISKLRNKIDKLENRSHRKNSSNSSIPPSKDENRVKPNQSLRQKSGKKTGGQKGHKGNTLKMQHNPNAVIEHKSDYCSCCAMRLTEESTLSGRRQVIDIPEIPPIVTEHRIYSTVCSCGHTNKGEYPEGVVAPVSYGSKLRALTGYLSVGQYMPMQRIVEMYDQVFNIKLSQGTISNMLTKLTNQCMPAYLELKRRVENSSVIGSDETGCVVNGNKCWMWVWQNNRFTYIAVSHSRGYQAITDNFASGFPDSTLLSDCWTAQLKTSSQANQICMSHIQRDLKFFIENSKNRWCRKFLNLIYEALELRRRMLEGVKEEHSKSIHKIRTTCSKLLGQNAKGTHKMQTLKKRLTKYANYLWTFLDNLNVPPDNNGSERAIRNVKVKQKVSGQFRSNEGAKQFAILRSIYDTARKNNRKAFDAFNAVAKFVPE